MHDNLATITINDYLIIIQYTVNVSNNTNVKLLDVKNLSLYNSDFLYNKLKVRKYFFYLFTLNNNNL